MVAGLESGGDLELPEGSFAPSLAVHAGWWPRPHPGLGRTYKCPFLWLPGFLGAWWLGCRGGHTLQQGGPSRHFHRIPAVTAVTDSVQNGEEASDPTTQQEERPCRL